MLLISMMEETEAIFLHGKLATLIPFVVNKIGNDPVEKKFRYLSVTGANEFFDMMRLIKGGGVIPIRIVIDIFAYKIVTNILHRMKIKVYICRTFNNGRTKLFSYE